MAMAMAMASSLYHIPINRASALSANPVSSSPSFSVVSFPFSVAAGPSSQLRASRTRRNSVPPLWEYLDYGSEDEDGVDWEDLILEETMSLMTYVRMILHSGRYQIGDQLTPEHKRIICERLLPYHPNSEKKIGPGIEYIIIGNHPVYVSSRCMFTARKDGEFVDFSYWKCLKGLVMKNYPQHADKFIWKHFGNRNLSPSR